MSGRSNMMNQRLAPIAAVLVALTVLTGVGCGLFEDDARYEPLPAPTSTAEPTPTSQVEPTLSTPTPPDEDPGTELWSYDTKGEIRSSPAVVEGVVYVGSKDDYLYAIDAANGDLLWRHQTGNDVYSSPAVSNGVVYVGSYDDYLYAIDAANGDLLWRHQTGVGVYSSPAVVEGVVYVGSGDDYVYAIDAANGDLLWRYRTAEAVFSSPAVSNGVVYVGSHDGYMYAIDAANGDLLWRYQTGADVYSSPAVSNGVVYVGSHDGYVYAIDAANGDLLWRYQTAEAVLSSPAVAYGVVYVGSYNGYVYAIDAANGDLLWSHQTDYPVRSSPAVVEGVVYVGSDDGSLHVIDAFNGDSLWRHQTGADVTSSPAVSNGVVYFGSLDSYVYAIVAEPPREFVRTGPVQARIEEIHFAGIATNTNLPSQVQVVFSLRDQNGHALVLPAEEIQSATQVYERGSGTDGWEEIDYAETSFFVHTAEKFDLEVVFALDFTNSMSQAKLPDGRSGIDAMVDAFQAGLDVLPEAHRIGVVEFHDRNADPQVLSTLTTDRQSIRASVGRFAQSAFDPGSSRVWDSVVAGSNLFSAREQNPRAVRALVFLSDGRDTSSVNVREDAQRFARERGVQLYTMGVGEVFQEEQLRQMADSTGGTYYPVHDPSQLQEQLHLIVNDLRGQYQVSYITLRRTGNYQAGISVELEGVRGSMETDSFDVASFFGSDNEGLIQFDPPTVDRTNEQATVFVRALHIPRNIDRIRFKLETSKPVKVDLVAPEAGGLLDDWTLSGPDADGFFEASSPTPVAFGNFGLMFRITVSDITEQSLELPVEFDNSIYTAGKLLRHPGYVQIGPPLPPTGRIAFSSNRDGGYEIYVMNADGSGVTRLNDHNGVEPTWSPDGQRIAFHSERDGNYEIYVMNADGTGLIRLTNDRARDSRPSWSPDGQRIAFESTRTGNWNIYVMNADGSGITNLTNPSATSESRPAANATPTSVPTPMPRGDSTLPRWSPDGQRIAFVSNRDGNVEIYLMNADGTGVTRLTNHGSEDSRPSWSPNGQQIAFDSNRDGNVEIYLMNADGSGLARLTDHPARDGHSVWSPDGRHIAFFSERDGDLQIYVMRHDGTGVTKLTDSSGNDVHPDWTAP